MKCSQELYLSELFNILFLIFIHFSFGLSKDAFADLVINSSLKTPLFLVSHSLLSAIKTLLFKCFTQSVGKPEGECCVLGITDLMQLISTWRSWWKPLMQCKMWHFPCGAQEGKVAPLRCLSDWSLWLGEVAGGCCQRVTRLQSGTGSPVIQVLCLHTGTAQDRFGEHREMVVCWLWWSRGMLRAVRVWNRVWLLGVVMFLSVCSRVQ